MPKRIFLEIRTVPKFIHVCTHGFSSDGVGKGKIFLAVFLLFDSIITRYCLLNMFGFGKNKNKLVLLWKIKIPIWRKP